MKLFSRIALLLVVLGSMTLPASAAEMMLAFNGKSSYQLVTPEPVADQYVEASIKQAAQVMVDAFAAQGVTLPVVSESKHDAGKNSIYLGNTKYASDNGVTFKSGSGWTYTFKVVGKNIIVAGHDEADPIPKDDRAERETRTGGKAMFGTLKAACEFVYTYAGTRFIQPGEFGVVHLQTPIMFVPDDLNFTHHTWASDVSFNNNSDPYYTATGLPPTPRVFTHYGHYHGLAFNDDDKKNHPEYFIFRAGKRQPNSGHFCFSNPEVRERIYQSILKDIDKGFDVIELGQMDGFTPCNCQECFDLYGIHPTHTKDQGYAYMQDSAWGEKIWLMHRDMAVRLLKDRPGKKLMLCAYSVAKNPPKTIDALPDNVIVQIMHPEADLMEKWSKLSVPGGYSTYYYLWGSFHLSGYTPRRSRIEMEYKINLALDYKMQIIQPGGKPINYGIEGINIYVYNRMLNNPNAKSYDDLYSEFIEAAYQESAGPMASFYRKLHQRLIFIEPAMEYARELNRNPLLMYSTIYTPDLLEAMQTHLDAAMKQAKSDDVIARLNNVAFEFKFLKQIAAIVNYYNTYLFDPNAQTHKRVVDAVEERNEWLKGLPEYTTKTPGVSRFWDRKVQAYKVNGRYMNIEPFNWDVKARRAMDLDAPKVKIPEVIAKRASKAVKIDSAQWDSAPSQTLSKVTRLATGDLEQATSFQVMYDENNLYVRTIAGVNGEDMVYTPRGRDAELWLAENINLQISPSGDKSQYFYLSYEPVADSFSDAEHGFITDILHPQFGWNDDTWNGEWTYVNKLDKANNQWVSMAIIPFKTLRAKTPASGSVWQMNLGRVHFKNQKAEPNNRKNREHSAWAGDINASKIPGDATLSPLVFE